MTYQYTMQSFFGSDENATYTNHLPIYQGNPMIEALPMIESSETIMSKLTYLPKVDKDIQLRSAEERIHLAYSIEDFFQPLVRHNNLFLNLSAMLYRGYVARNPFDIMFWRQRDQALEALHPLDDHPHVIQKRRTSLSSAFIGASGIGKSRSLEMILSLYPQVIHHRSYQGQIFTWTQLVWLKLECPPDGSIRSLALQFLLVVDGRLGTTYYRMYGRNGRASKDELLYAMATISSLHSIGILVIDEIQTLSEAKSGGATQMLNFFVQLVNLLSLPVFLIGTFKASFLFAHEFRQARRATGSAPVIWEPLDAHHEWDMFLTSLWRYQYTQKYVDLTPLLSSLLYDMSQGITDIAIKLFITSQIQAIQLCEEKLSADRIKKTANSLLTFVRPYLDALRVRDLQRLSTMNDIQLPSVNQIIEDLSQQ